MSKSNNILLPESTVDKIVAILRWEAHRVYPLRGPVPDPEEVLKELEQQKRFE